jgi:hypothetical protein
MMGCRPTGRLPLVGAASMLDAMAGINEEDVLAALDVPRTAMEVSEMLPGLAVWNFERVRQRLLALERQRARASCPRRSPPESAMDARGVTR